MELPSFFVCEHRVATVASTVQYCTVRVVKSSQVKSSPVQISWRLRPPPLGERSGGRRGATGMAGEP